MNCLRCNKAIEGRKSDAKYCSESCRVQASKQRRNESLQLEDIPMNMALVTQPTTIMSGFNAPAIVEKFAGAVVNRAGAGFGDAIGKATITSSDSTQNLIHYAMTLTGGATGVVLLHRSSKKSGEKKELGSYVIAAGVGMAGGELAYRGFRLIGNFWNERKTKKIAEQQSNIALSDGQNSAKYYSGADLAFNLQPSWTYNGRYSTVIGNELSEHFQVLIYGAPGHGKSHVAAEIAADLSRYGKVLYALAEESVNSVVQKRLERYGIYGNKRIEIGEVSTVRHIVEMMTAHPDAKFFVLDSLSGLIPRPDEQVQFLKWLRRVPKIFGSVLVAQVNKDESMRGSGELSHVVDSVLRVQDYVVTPTMKNRFSGKGSVDVFPENRQVDSNIISQVIQNTERRL